MKKRVFCILMSVVLLCSGILPAAAYDLNGGFDVDIPFITVEAQTGDYETPYEDSRFLVYGDYLLHFRVVEAENPVGQIMMIHGFALSGFCWQPLAELLAEQGYTCVLVDLPGYGYSTRETATTNMIEREELIYALMTHLSDEEWIVAGHSMGGYYAQGIMQQYPDAVSSLLLYGTAGNEGMSDSFKKMMTFRPITVIMGGIMELFVKLDFVFDAALKMGMQDDEYLATYDVAKVKDPLLIKGTGAGAIYCFVDVPETDFLALRTCGKPIFYCNGSQDTIIPVDARVKFAAHLPSDAVCATIEGGAHMFIENRADEVAALTLDFLK